MNIKSAHKLQATRWIIQTYKSIREARGWSQLHLANRLGVTQSSVGALESMRRPDPHISTIARLGASLELDVTIHIYDPRTGERISIPLTSEGLTEVP